MSENSAQAQKARLPVPEVLEMEIETPAAPVERNQGLEGFNPVAYMPQDVPRTKAARWKRIGRTIATGGHALKAVELKCIDYCGWERSEAARCEVTTCALWALNRRIFAA